MLRELTPREIEIIRLREEESWTFRAIGTQFGVSDSRAFQIYRQIQRRRREAKRLLLALPENRVLLSFSLSRGEATVLEKILSAVLEGYLDRPLQIGDHGLDPDFLYAEELHRRLLELLSTRHSV